MLKTSSFIISTLRTVLQQLKLVLVEFDDAVVAQPAELSAHGTAVDGEKVGEFLSVEGDDKSITAGVFRAGGKI